MSSTKTFRDSYLRPIIFPFFAVIYIFLKMNVQSTRYYITYDKGYMFRLKVSSHRNV